MQDLIGTMMGQYQIQRFLARGGMATIYQACDTESDRIVAIKLVYAADNEYCDRFRLEAIEMAALEHKHILPVLDYGEYAPWCYLVMPYIKRGTLDNLLMMGPMDIEDTGLILDQLTSALHYAHEQGIVHRDIKPSNILVSDGPHVYLADFGLVKHIGVKNGLTHTGFLVGTPEYMAPELAEDEATPRSDVYAVGVLLYRMLCGQVPFKSNTPLGIYLKHVQEKPVPPSIINPKIPIPIEAVVQRALAKDPRERFQTAQDLFHAYQQALITVSSQIPPLEEMDEKGLELSPSQISQKRQAVLAQRETHHPSLQWSFLTPLKNMQWSRSQQYAFVALAAVALFAGALLSGTNFSHASSAPQQTIEHQTNKKMSTPTMQITPTFTPTATVQVAPLSPAVATDNAPSTQSGNNANQNPQGSGTNNSNGNGNNSGNGNDDKKGKKNGNGNGNGHKKK